MSTTTMKRPRCVGLLGRIFGHQFVKNKGGWIYQADYCFRCGLEAGDS